MDADAQSAVTGNNREGPRPTEELIALALAEKDSQRQWDMIGTLRQRATREVFEAAVCLSRSRSAKERTLGADILAQLGAEVGVAVEDQPFYEERSDVLIGLLSDKRVGVLSSAAIGLGHMMQSRAVKPLVRLKDHPSAEVRHAVAFGLLTQEDERAIRALIDLSEDPDPEVRDWATFRLGSQIDADTPEIRDALFRRLQDPDLETRGEAMVGLARRKDPRVFEPVREELLRGDVGIRSVEAAKELADPRLCGLLHGLRERWLSDGRGWQDGWDSDLEDAIAACRSQQDDRIPGASSSDQSPA